MADDDRKGGGDENALIAERRAKLARLRAAGTAFPNDFRRDALAADLHATYGGRSDESLAAQPVRVRVAGRMLFKRVMGKASFAKLQDGSGQIQAYLQAEPLGAAYEEFKGWDVGDILGIEGPLMRTRAGELSVRAESARLLVKALRPLPDKWHGLADTETRYRQRYVDLIVNETARATFQRRTQVVRWLRDFLDAQGFLEVETPMMQPIPGGALARPFVTHHNALGQDMYLRIAPELYLKRLLVGGLERVYEINRNFRNEGLSTQHNPEFTMLELYQAYADCDGFMGLVERMFQGLADAIAGAREIGYQGRRLSFATPFARVSVEQAVLERHPGLGREGLRDAARLRAACAACGVETGAGDGAGTMLMALFEKSCEQRLVQPTFVHSYPTEVSPLSRQRDADPFLADRFELYVDGRELANGFSELNDPEEQAARFREQAARRGAGDAEAMAFDADYIRALEYGMPPAAGLGVGVDRLVMLLTDSPSIRDVLLFPQLRHEDAGD
jgi:lysyl-tRNA synthetase class 2